VQLTVTVITHNEQDHIAAALDSVAWADEVIVVDSGSTDQTAEIARGKATRVIVREWPGYSAQKNFAADQASNDWVLSMDADERVTPGLAQEIRALMARPLAARGYRIRRVSWYLGTWIKTTDWCHDYQLRLYDRRAGRWNGLRIHESFRLSDGKPGQLSGTLEHYAYTSLVAEQWLDEGRTTTPLHVAVQPVLAFLRNYVMRAGFRQGTTGLVISVLNSYYVFLKFAKLWERQRRG
jgi:glycosyltransferase involved in cell wall biosynthesis